MTNREPNGTAIVWSSCDDISKQNTKIERLRAERDDWHKIADARSAEINRLVDKLADNKRLLQQIATWIYHTVPHDILVENCEACRRVAIIRTALGDEP